MLKSVIDEPSYEVKKQILQLIAVLAKHEMLRGTWDELFAFIDLYVKSNDENERKVRFDIIVFISYLTKFFLKIIY